jgi:hypothetical protein
MTIALSANTPRVSYTVSQSATQTAFTVNFEFFDDADLNFYVDGTLKTLTTHYTVSGGSGSTGTINTTAGNTVTGISGGSTVVITRDIALARTTDFPSSGAFEVATLNTELDRFTAIAADLKDSSTRSLRLADDDSAATMTLPTKASRLGKILGFHSSTGIAEVVNHITTAAVNVSTVSVGGSATASVSQSGNTATFALGIPTGATGATGATGPSTSFTITDGLTSQTLENSNTLTITSGEGIDATVSATDTLTIAGEDATVTNKGIASFSTDNFAVSSGAVTIKDGGVNLTAEVTGTLPIANGGIGATSLAAANIVATNAQNTFTKAQLASTYTAALSATSGVLDYDTYQNFIITLASGSNTLAAATTEASQVGQTGVIIFIQPSSSTAGTVSLHGDYETAEAAGLTLSSANNDYDVVPYIVKADNSILLGSPQLNFG